MREIFFREVNESLCISFGWGVISFLGGKGVLVNGRFFVCVSVFLLE